MQFETKDLPNDALQRLSDHVASCLSCKQMIAVIKANVAEYEAGVEQQRASLRAKLMAAAPPQDLFSAGSRRASSWLNRKTAILAASLAAAAAVAVFLLPDLYRVGDRARSPAATHGMGFKGNVTFEVVAKRDGRQFRVAPGAELIPNDALRFVVNTTSSGYLSIFALDNQKRLSPFYPETRPEREPEPMVLNRPGRHELPGSIVLDDMTGDEYYVIVFSKHRFDRRDVHARLKQVHLDQDFVIEDSEDLYIRSLKVKKKTP
ncbi:MAG: hypothetical protein QNJ97_23500 [Myxococcota bacterium]|nr:hypothetical protein [Myxococcota bacterium]